MAYELRQLVLDEDRSFLVDILEKNLEFSNGAEGVINWNNEKSRYPAQCMILEHKADNGDKEKIGNICTFYRDFNYLGKRLKVGIFGNLVIEEKHRSLQPAMMLTKGNAKKAVDSLPFLYVFPNEKAIGVFKISGFKVVGDLIRYAYINSYNHFLGEKIPVIGNIAGIAIDLAKNFIFSIGHSITSNEYESRVEDGFPDALHTLFKNSLLSQFICNYRDNEYMNWRYINNPEYSYKILNSYKKADSKLVASCVFDVDENVLFIRDLIFENEKSFQVVIKALKKWAVNNDIKSISVRFMGSPIIKALLKKNGFCRRESGRVVVTKTSNKDMLPNLVNENNWFILDGDEDI
jgi:hypothetical protein